jgi:hypothetical protein
MATFQQHVIAIQLKEQNNRLSVAFFVPERMY